MPSESVVFVVDDDAAVRDSLTMLLKLAGHKVDAYESATRFLSEAKPSPSDCLIADVRMPEMDGLELQHELVRRQSPLPIIIVTGHGDIPLAVQAMKAGAVDFLEKPFARDVLLTAVRRALERTTRHAVSEVAQDEIGRRIARLTEREREVYDRVVAGKQSKIIAHELGTSPRTIEIHRARMMHKMQARNLQELVRMAIASRTLPGG
ncbi:MAG TPA: response regulator FixJ [Rhizomicrobium sp.]|nr:response regulator FixJ [Rhizomicrobium sp.]